MPDLKVNLENIIPLTYARDHFSTIITEVQRDKLYILTKGGKPAVAIIDVRYLEQLTGGEIKKETIKEEISKNPEQVGLPKMVEHDSTSRPFDSAPSAPKPAPISSPTPAFTPTPPPQSSGSLKFQPTPPPSFHKPTEPSPTPKPPFTPPATTPTPGSLILPDEHKPAPATPPNPPASPASDEKVEIEFTTENADLDGGPKEQKTEKKRIDPDDKAPAAQYNGEDNGGPKDEVEEMAID